MDETLKEFGKGLFNFANLGMVLIYFQHISEDISNLGEGAVFGSLTYLFAFILVLIGRSLELEREELK